MSLVNTLAWLECNAKEAIDALPRDRDLSYLEVTLFCLVSHLEFKGVLTTDPYRNLRQFCQGFAARASSVETAYRFDGY